MLTTLGKLNLLFHAGRKMRHKWQEIIILFIFREIEEAKNFMDFYHYFITLHYRIYMKR